MKRLFVERDCKYSRLAKVCEVLGLTVADVLDVAERQAEAVDVLSEVVEQALAKSPSLFWFFMLLREEMTTGEIGTAYQPSETDVYLYCRELEELGLLMLTSNGGVERISTHAIRFTQGGPLHELYKRLNLAFMARVIDKSINTTESFVSVSRRMRPESARLMSDEIEALMGTIRRLARQDRLTSADTELVAYKWSIASGPASFKTLMDIVPHAQKQSP